MMFSQSFREMEPDETHPFRLHSSSARVPYFDAVTNRREPKSEKAKKHPISLSAINVPSTCTRSPNESRTLSGVALAAPAVGAWDVRSSLVSPPPSHHERALDSSPHRGVPDGRLTLSDAVRTRGCTPSSSVSSSPLLCVLPERSPQLRVNARTHSQYRSWPAGLSMSHIRFRTAFARGSSASGQ